MPSTVIDRVNDMAKDQPRLLTFADRDGNEILSDGYEEELTTPPHEIPGVIGDVTTIPGVDIGIEPEDIETSKNDLGNTPTTNEPIIEQDVKGDVPEFEPTKDVEADATEFEPTAGEAPMEEQAESPKVPSSTRKKKTTTQAPPIHAKGTRRSSRDRKTPQSFIPSMKGKFYGYSAAQFDSIEHDPRVVEMVLTQLTLKAAIKMWGNEATHAAEAEMKQLHWRNSFKPVRWRDLSNEQRATVLELHMFMKQKQTGEIKDRTVAGGNKQRGFIEKEDSSSPTVATEWVILTSIIDAEEERDTAAVDIPNAFIQTFVKVRRRESWFASVEC